MTVLMIATNMWLPLEHVVVDGRTKLHVVAHA